MDTSSVSLRLTLHFPSGIGLRPMPLEKPSEIVTPHPALRATAFSFGHQASPHAPGKAPSKGEGI
jgi:hypothetical protein